VGIGAGVVAAGEPPQATVRDVISTAIQASFENRMENL
jgi:hypothetical protein